MYLEFGRVAIAAAVWAFPMTAQDPGPGISRELAESRAGRFDALRYRLAFDLDPESDQVVGRVAIEFEIGADDRERDVVLDWLGAPLEAVRVNGLAPGAGLRTYAEHVVVGAELLGSGLNTIEAVCRSPVASTGTPLTRYEDPNDRRCYLYTLLVPAEAHRLFPCIDQPDVRASFELELVVPREWTAVANAAESNDPATAESGAAPRELDDGRLRFAFAPTELLPTYLFAFAAGPFEVVQDTSGRTLGTLSPGRQMRILMRAQQRQHADTDLLFDMHHRAAEWLGRWFGVAYPFGKLDIVLLPGFPYGGMEHAGAIFYRENALVFERRPTVAEEVRRSTLIYHEVAHQWFGNLVTMRWFDDLWLKEGFATLLGYRLLEELEPERQAWLRFLQRVKPGAYAVDVTAGTTPIFQELANLADAKSNYGPIVYDKAPAVLRELENRLGRPRFRAGLQRFVEQHAFGAATWRDLMLALQGSGARGVDEWADAWILGAGLPRVRAHWEVRDDGTIGAFEVVQENLGDSRAPWPLTLDVWIRYADGSERRESVTANGARTAIAELVGTAAPLAVLLNAGDVAYGQFLADDRSARWLIEHAGEIEDPLIRAVAFSTLYQGVREAEIDPRRFARSLLERLGAKDDAETHGWLLAMLQPVLTRWVTGEDRDELVARATAVLLAQIDAGRADIALTSLRFLLPIAADAEFLERVRALLDGSTTLAGVDLAPRDRFLAAAALLASGDADAVDREIARVGEGSDIGREVYVARAAAADAAVKARYFADYVRGDEPPERWIQDSLETFHWSGQQELTLPWLRPALDRVEWVKANRRIFFMPAWIDAFVNGHSSAAALQTVRQFLEENEGLSLDVRRKILQSADALARTVRIREAFGG